jgi:DNA mismatch endonuclease (patch repair protein)
MTDSLTPERRSWNMGRIRAKDTRPEVFVRQLAHALGFRFRLHRKDLPGTPDLVFPGRRKVIFVHGCFWHGHSCREGLRRPRSNQDYWLPKITRNQARDLEHLNKLIELGWESLVIWECEISDPALPERIQLFLGR